MPKLHFMYTHDNSIGYGRMGTQLHQAFSKIGVDVLEGLAWDSPDVATKTALWASLPNNARGWYEGQYVACMTMWEATRLPEALRESLHNFDRIIVPSMHNLELFGQYHDNVQYVPLGVNPETWKYHKRQPVGATFRFLADGRGPRKGSDLSIKAFTAAFKGRKTNGTRPILMLKGRRASMDVNVAGRQDVQVIGAKLTDEQEVDLYASAHVYLAPSRGEGWGLQPMQAIAQGCPTILTDAHGQASFAHLGWGLRSKLSKADYFAFGDAGEWWEPDLDQLVEYMRWMFDNYEQGRQMAQLFSDDALSQFTWENSAKDICNLLPLSDTEWTPGKWHEMSYKKYPIVLRLPWVCEVAGRKYHFDANKLYYERAEIKRILFEGGWLDPVCYEMPGEDSGLVEEQVERLDLMKADHACCPYCGQEFNSKPLYEYPEGGSSGL